MPKSFYCKYGNERVRTSKLLAEGGEGIIYEISGRKDVVAKVYKKKKANYQFKIDSMWANPPEKLNTAGHDSIVWPLDLLFLDSSLSNFAGFLMKKIGGSEELQEISNPGSLRKKSSYRHFTHEHLYIAAANVANVFARVHEKGYVIGDVKDQNILINNSALITLVDTDSFQVFDKKHNELFHCPVGTELFTPPELQDTNFSSIKRKPEHDNFGLAVIVFQLLMQGRQPYDGKPLDNGDWSPKRRIKEGNFPYGSRKKPLTTVKNTPPFSALHPSVRNLFVRCFENGKKRPSKRPSAKEWMRTLLKSRKELIVCKTDAKHRYSNEHKSCPWCSYYSNLRRSPAKVRKSKKRTPVPQYKAPVPFPTFGGTSKPTFKPPPPPPPEIVPGRWIWLPDQTDPSIQMANAYAQMLGGMDSKNEYILNSSGSLQGRTYISYSMMTLEMQISGTWSYNQFNKLLSMQGLLSVNMGNMNLFGGIMDQWMNAFGGGMNIPPQPLNIQLEIKSSAGRNRYKVYDRIQGVRGYLEKI